MRHPDLGKCVTPAVMAAIMQTLPADALVMPNDVGNLLIFVNGEAIAYIDLADEEVVSLR